MRLARAVHRLDVTWGNRPATAAAGRRAGWLRAAGLSCAVVALAAGYLTAGRPPVVVTWLTPGPHFSASWSVAPYSAYGNPVAAGGSVFAYSPEDPGAANDEPAMIDAFDAATGRVEWTYPLTWSEGVPDPVVAAGTVYVVGANWLYALSAASGRLLWMHAIKSDLGSGPAASGSSVYFGDNGHLYALDASSGKTRWTAKVPFGAASEPDVGTIGDVVFDVAAAVGESPDEVMYGFSALNGHLLWSRNVTSLKPAASTGDTSAAVYLSTGAGTLAAIDGLNGTIIWSSSIKGVATYPVVDGTTVYVGTFYGDSSGVVYAINAQTGKVRWSYTPGDISDIPPIIESIGVGGNTVSVETDNTEYALSADDGSLQWAYYYGYTNNIDSDYLGPMAVVHGEVYLGIDSSVLALRGGSSQ
jgi:outer membrane protein assembly factor BamB